MILGESGIRKLRKYLVGVSIVFILSFIALYMGSYMQEKALEKATYEAFEKEYNFSMIFVTIGGLLSIMGIILVFILTVIVCCLKYIKTREGI